MKLVICPSHRDKIKKCHILRSTIDETQNFSGWKYLKVIYFSKIRCRHIVWWNNYLVCKRTLNHLAKLARWFSCVVSTYLYGAFGCMFLSWHVLVSEWNPHSIVAWMSRNSLSKQARNLKFKWLQLGFVWICYFP